MFTTMVTLGQVFPLIPSQFCMHLGTCAKGRFGACTHKAILYKIVDRLGKIKQAIHNVLCALCVQYYLGSRPIYSLALRTSLAATAILTKILEEKSSFPKAMFGYPLKCVEPSLSWLQYRK